MVPSLRKEILNLNFSDIKEQNEQNILYQIQKIFTNLQDKFNLRHIIMPLDLTDFRMNSDVTLHISLRTTE